MGELIKLAISLWNGLVKDKRNVPFLLLIGLLCAIFSYTTVSTADLKELEGEVREGREVIDTVKVAQARVEAKLDVLFEHLTGQRFPNGNVERFPPPKYLVDFIGGGGTPPSDNGWDSVKVRLRGRGMERDSYLCYYTTPDDTVAVTEVK